MQVINSWISSKSSTRKPYRLFLNISIFALISYCIAFSVLIAQEIYMKKGVDLYPIVSVPTLILMGCLAMFLYNKLKFFDGGGAINQGLFVFLGVAAVVETLFGVLCLVVILFIWIYGFGHFEGMS